MYFLFGCAALHSLHIRTTCSEGFIQYFILAGFWWISGQPSPQNRILARVLIICYIFDRRDRIVLSPIVCTSDILQHSWFIPLTRPALTMLEHGAQCQWEDHHSHLWSNLLVTAFASGCATYRNVSAETNAPKLKAIGFASSASVKWRSSHVTFVRVEYVLVTQWETKLRTMLMLDFECCRMATFCSQSLMWQILEYFDIFWFTSSLSQNFKLKKMITFSLCSTGLRSVTSVILLHATDTDTLPGPLATT